MKNNCCGKILIALVALLVTFATTFPQQVYAAETKLTTHVPANAELTITTDRGVFINGIHYAKGSEISVTRLSLVTIDLNPEEGKEVDRVYLGDEDVTNLVEDGVLTAEVNFDSDLQVTYKTASAKEVVAFTNNLSTGDHMSVTVWGFILSASTILLLVAFARHRRRD